MATYDYAILGLGLTGYACAEYLYQQGKRIIVLDDRQQPPLYAQLQASYPDIPVRLGGYDTSLLTSAQQIVVSPGIPFSQPQLAQQLALGKTVVGDVELFARAAKAPVVAITGSNGKSTVAKLLTHVCEKAGLTVQLGGNIGKPVLSLLSEPVPDYYILELSSFQLTATHTLAPHAATVLNITPDHLDWHADFAAYVAAKQRIYRGCTRAVINADDPATFTESASGSFTIHAPKAGQFGLIEKDEAVYLAQGDVCLMDVAQLPLPGKHYYSNALAVLALGQTMGLSIEAMLLGLSSYSGLAHRCQKVYQQDQVTWYNDSKATNIGACIAAVESIAAKTAGRLILIVGGLTKGVDLSPLTPVFSAHVDYLLILGSSVAEFTAVAPEIPTKALNSFAEIVAFAHKIAQPSDAVLLSPAAASFDLFDNYQHRGDEFVKAIKDELCFGNDKKICI